MKKITAVFDTNIYLSAILFDGNCRRCLELARNNQIVLCTSHSILLEIAGKLSGKFGWSREDIEEVIKGIGVFARIISSQRKLQVIKTDESDNRVLECAVSGKVDYIVSGDKKHILSLKEYRGIKIVNPKQFLDKMSSS